MPPKPKTLHFVSRRSESFRKFSGVFGYFCADMLPESRGEKKLFHGPWNLPRIFREISCGQFSWKSKDENRRIFSPIFATFFAHVSERFGQSFALGAIRHKIFSLLLKDFLRGRQVGDGMGWWLERPLLGRPDLASFCGKVLCFPGFGPKIGAPQKRPFLPPPIPSPT